MKHALSALEKAIGYKPSAQRQRWNKKIMREEFEKLRDKKGIWVEKARRAFVDSYGAYKKFSAHHQHVFTLRQRLHRILFARTEETTRQQVDTLRRIRVPATVTAQKRQAVRFLQRYLDTLTTYHAHEGMPRTTNLVENVNKQIQRRMKTIEAFQHRTSAEQYMNFLVAYLRQKPYTDCRGERRRLNGKSRLEAAGVVLDSKDWLNNCLKNP